jgi:hypothetical protein
MDGWNPIPSLSKTLIFIVIMTVVCYILISVIKRLSHNVDLLIIPLCLSFANFFILVELFYLVKIKNASCSKKNRRLIFFQLILNLCFLLYIASFFLLK